MRDFQIINSFKYPHPTTLLSFQLTTHVRAVTLIMFSEFSKYSLIFLLNFPPKIRIFSEYVFPSSSRRHDGIVGSLLSHETQNNNVLTNVTFATMSEKIIRFGLQQDTRTEKAWCNLVLCGLRDKLNLDCVWFGV